MGEAAAAAAEGGERWGETLKISCSDCSILLTSTVLADSHLAIPLAIILHMSFVYKIRGTVCPLIGAFLKGRCF